MTRLRVVVFDVQHGFCAFLRTPAGHTMFIDCGKGDSFSPVEYVLGNELTGATIFNEHRLTAMVVSHPHDDHIEDIDRLATELPPAILYRQSYDWQEIKESGIYEDHENLDRYADWQRIYNLPITNPPEWGMGIQRFCLTPDRAKEIDEASHVNNSSIVVVATFQGTLFREKFLFGGDMEEAGWSELLKNPSFRDSVSDVDIYVASHHGHASGFSSDLFNVMGRPLVTIVSAHERDTSVDKRYSAEDYVRGIAVNGEVRRMFSTRNDGSICIDVDEQGKFLLSCRSLKANLKYA